MTTLESLGWSPFFAQQLASLDCDGFSPARVVEEQKDRYRVLDPEGEHAAELAGRLRHEAEDGALLPCVGDWVLVRREAQGPAMIRHVLARRTRFARRAAGERTAEQVVAANADTVFVVQSLNRDLNLRRLERYLALLWESGATPVVLLNKSDLCEDVASAVEQVSEVASGVDVHVTSALRGDGLEEVRAYLREGLTVVLTGSSGVGKSTLANRLLGQEVQVVQDIREDDRGRHTTTSRRILSIPGGGLLMDTPGMRTVLMWDAEDGIEQVFSDIAEYALECRFRDCTHVAEPGCGVLAAMEDGRLEAERMGAYRKLVREQQFVAAKQDVAVRLEQQRKWRVIHRANRSRPDKRKI